MTTTKKKVKPGSDCGCNDEADYSAETDDEFATLTTVPDGDEPADLDPDPRGTMVRTFKNQLIAPYGMPTGDKRRFAKNSLSVGELPIPVKWQREDNAGHSTSVVVGRIDKVNFADDGVYASGVIFDPDPDKTPRWNEDCNEAYGLLKERVIGPSVDLDSMEYHEYVDTGEQYSAEQRPEVEVDKGRIRAGTLVAIPAFMEARPFALGEQDALEYAAELDEMTTLTASGVPQNFTLEVATDHQWDPLDWLGRGVYAMNGATLYSDGERTLFPIADLVDGRLQLIPAAVADAVSVLAFKSAQVDLPEGVKQAMREQLDTLVEACELPTPPWHKDDALVAAGGFRDWKPSAAMFEDPKLDKPTPIQIKDGRIFGHLADWRSCHIGFSHCVRAPRSRSNYAHFHVGQIETDKGPLAVGKVTIGGGHASTAPGVSFQAAVEHYDDATTAAAVVRAGEDRHGIWISGVAIPGREDEFASLPLYPMSGDWRDKNGRPEMIAALAVNTPGFGIPRVTEEKGRVTALVAAGMLDEYRAIDIAERKKLAAKGQANPDLSYPIENVDDLKNAIQAYGRAGNKPATRRLIMRMARKLNAENLIPESWRGSHAKDYSTDAELLDEVRQEWLDDMAAEVLTAGALVADATFERLHVRGFHGKFIKKLIGHHDGDGGDAGAGGGKMSKPFGAKAMRALRRMSEAETGGGRGHGSHSEKLAEFDRPGRKITKVGADSENPHDLGMTQGQRMDAYADVKDRFELKARQRDKLDASPGYASILKAAHSGNWEQVGRLLKQHGIIDYTPTERRQRRGNALDSDYAAILEGGLDALGELETQQAALAASKAF